jgi:hypothetical protein
MKPILSLSSISQISRLLPGWKASHPLAAVIDFSRYDEYIEEGTRISADFY